MLERDYQPHIIDKIERMLPECFILKNDTEYMQGVPDLTIFYFDRWAVLEVKKSSKARRRPNQPYYIDLLDRMSFAAFICPENEEEVLDALQHALTASRSTRVPKRK